MREKININYKIPGSPPPLGQGGLPGGMLHMPHGGAAAPPPPPPPPPPQEGPWPAWLGMPHHLALPPPLAQGGHNQWSAQERDELVNGLVRYAGRRWCNILRGSVILQAGGKTQKAMKDKWRNLQNAARRLAF